MYFLLSFMPPRPVLGPCPPCYRGFETVAFLHCEGVILSPNPKPGVPGYLSFSRHAQNVSDMGGRNISCAVAGWL
jgi:hypothetical protein